MIGTMTEVVPPAEQDRTTTMTVRRAMEEVCGTPMTTTDAKTSDSEPEAEAGPRIAMGESLSGTMIWNPIEITLCLKRIASGTGHLRGK
jgi:hypothetical protein